MEHIESESTTTQVQDLLGHPVVCQLDYANQSHKAIKKSDSPCIGSLIPAQKAEAFVAALVNMTDLRLFSAPLFLSLLPHSFRFPAHTHNTIWREEDKDIFLLPLSSFDGILLGAKLACLNFSLSSHPLTQGCQCTAHQP